MRPPNVYAKRTCPAGDPCDLLGLLHGRHRVGCRLVMILLSQQRWTPTEIAELLGCDPRTVRRWVHRYNQHGTNGLTELTRSVRRLERLSLLRVVGRRGLLEPVGGRGPAGQQAQGVL
jgi:hypothetical protein